MAVYLASLPPNHVFNRPPPVKAFYLATVGGGVPVNLVSLGARSVSLKALQLVMLYRI
jgi:hypothetical protein